MKNLTVAALVIFLALAGTATAAKLITGKQVKDGSLTGADVKNRSLTKKDFKGSVRGPRGLQGPAGKNGTNGINGTNGRNGANGATNVRVRLGNPTTFDAANPGVATASCLPGERATGGGLDTSESDSNPLGAISVIETAPTPGTAGFTPTGWRVSVSASGGTGLTATAYVVCASP